MTPIIPIPDRIERLNIMNIYKDLSTDHPICTVLADGGRLLSGSRDASLRVWDTITGTSVRTARTSGSPIAHLRFGQKADVFVECGEGKEVRCALALAMALVTLVALVVVGCWGCGWSQLVRIRPPHYTCGAL